MFSAISKGVKLLAVTVMLLSASSCATYHQRIAVYHADLQQGNFDKANADIEKVDLLKKNRNRILYLMEKGRTFHLMQQYDSSNLYLNQADLAIEDSRKTGGDVLAAQLLNPMMTHYRPEDFETFMVYYYKALNYCYLGDTEAALVEVRRITLQLNKQDDKTGGKDGKYTGDAFAMILQGIIYEKAGDINNAFIAYRNAVDIFIGNSNTYFGVTMPTQLKKDLLRTAHLMGFDAEQARYERLFGLTYQPAEKPEGGEAVLIWENGMAPVKEQETIQFNVIAGDGGFFFRDNYNRYNFPFDNTISGYNSSLRLSDIQMFAIALPRYAPVPVVSSGATIALSGVNYTFEKAEDIGNIAVASLQQRFGKELATALSRMALKKLAEMALTPNRDKDDTKKSKKEKRADDIREALAIGLKIFNRATEKADTRNWQSLPGNIYYCRIPLQQGVNTLTINIETGNSRQQKVVVLEGNRGIQFYSLYSMK